MQPEGHMRRFLYKIYKIAYRETKFLQSYSQKAIHRYLSLYGIIKRQRYLSRLDCHNLDSGDESNPDSMLNVNVTTR